MTLTTTQRIATLEEEVVTLKAMLGVQFLDKSSAELKAALVAASQLPGGRYPYILDSYQLHSAIDEMRAAPASTQPPAPAPTPPAPTPAPTPAPAPTGPTIPPLSDTDIARVNTAMNNGVVGGFPIAPQRDQIASELAQGKYSLFNNNLIDAVKLWFYNGASGADKDALYKYLAILDQRDPQTNAQLAPTDPRVKQVSGSAVAAPAPVPVATAPIPSGDIAGIVQALAFTYNVHIARNVVSVGIAPDAESKAGLQVGGEAEAEVYGISNTRGSDAQNPGEVHRNTLSICANDGGFRAIQYGNWGKNGLRRNTTNRPMTIRAMMDSMGEACWSVDPLEASEKSSIRLARDGRMYGQLYYERVDWVAKKVVLTAFQPGWTVEVAGSSAYGDSGVRQL